jgi:hypothetical protein
MSIVGKQEVIHLEVGFPDTDLLKPAIARLTEFSVHGTTSPTMITVSSERDDFWNCEVSAGAELVL